MTSEIVESILRIIEPLLLTGLPSGSRPDKTEVTEDDRRIWRAYITAIVDAGLPSDAAEHACRWLIRNSFNDPWDWAGPMGERYRRLNYRQHGYPAPVVQREAA